MELVSEKGYFAVTTNDIAKKAGISIGSLYSHFKDKKALMIACVECYYDLVSDTIYQNPVDNSVMPYLSASIETVFTAHEIMPGFHRAMMAACLQDPDIRAIETAKDKEAKQRVFYLLEKSKSIIRPANLLLTADMIYLIISETVHKYMNGEIEHSRKELVEELAYLIKAYLFYVSEIA